MMKKILLLLVLVSASLVLSAEDPVVNDQTTQKYPTGMKPNQRPKSPSVTFPRWSVHSNLLGFLQFGPVLSAEYGFTRNLALNAHVRFSRWALTPILYQADVDDGGRPDQFSGIAFGGGPMWFIQTKKDKAYVGFILNMRLQMRCIWRTMSTNGAAITKR
ncbi:MAG: hypothetical protein U5L72_09330 [Bacteroidales bacterium]|nr:hypothetical protein [Bacteroidales bacterium]